MQVEHVSPVTWPFFLPLIFLQKLTFVKTERDIYRVDYLECQLPHLWSDKAQGKKTKIVNWPFWAVNYI